MNEVITMSGPLPKPTALRIYEGNRGHQKLNDREATPLTGEPAMPKHLDQQARIEWKRLVPLLLSMRVLSEAAGIALGILCSAYSTLIRAQEMMVKSATGSSSAY
jgi:phage terminase small subunit